MAACDDCFEHFVHPLVHESQDKNERFREKYGQRARWDWDDKHSTLTFTDSEKPTLEIDVSNVRTTEGSSWEWAWANKNIPPKNFVTSRGSKRLERLGKGRGATGIEPGAREKR